MRQSRPNKIITYFLLFFFTIFTFLNPMTVYAVNIVCPQPNESGTYPPYFDSTIGYCLTYPIDEGGTCPSGYLFNPTSSKCIALPVCDDPSYVYNLSTKKCVLVESDQIDSGEFLDPNVFYCGVDLSGDGELSRNEITECVEDQNGGYICPLDWVQCSPSCPSGTSYNSSTGKCEASAQWKCSVNGRIYSSRSTCNNSCYKTAACTGKWTCITRIFSFNYYGPGYYWDRHAYMDSNCVLHLGVNTKVKCWDYNDNRIPTTFYPGQEGFCSAYETICDTEGCKSGFSPTRYIGNKSYVTYSCPLGNYSCSGKPPQCSKSTSCSVSCPSGTSYNSSTGKCESFPNWTCPYGKACQFVTSQNAWMCSSTDCSKVDQAEDLGDIEPTGYIDDGEKDDNGNCLGQLLIFNGFKQRCRTSGVETGFQNCCDESQGVVYDDTGSYHSSFGTVKNVIAAIMFSKQMVELGYYATKIAEGVYKLKPAASSTYKLMQGTKVIKIMEENSPEHLALQSVTTGMDSTTAINTATTTYATQYVKTYGGDIALAVINLAVGQVIEDPILQATVNLAATVVLASGLPLPGGYTLALSNPALAIGLAVVQLGLAFFAGGCDAQDIITSTFIESKRCHYIGKRCIKKWFGHCVQKSKVYCCFNSKLARIIHEQGRPQLSTTISSWGDTKHPNCRGFTPEEFQAIDFGRIDLSEYYSDIERNIRENIEESVNIQMQETYQGLKQGERPN